MTPLPDEYSEQEKEKAAPRPTKPAVRWENAGVKSVYANVCNVTGTREEVVLDFGIHNPWDQAVANAANIQLTSRILMSPHACRRLALMLQALTREYEARYGPLEGEQGD